MDNKRKKMKKNTNHSQSFALMNNEIQVLTYLLVSITKKSYRSSQDFVSHSLNSLRSFSSASLVLSFFILIYLGLSLSDLSDLSHLFHVGYMSYLYKGDDFCGRICLIFKQI